MPVTNAFERNLLVTKELLKKQIKKYLNLK